jgi:hypothetical protein
MNTSSAGEEKSPEEELPCEPLSGTPAKEHAWSSSVASPLLARSRWMERTKRERKERARTDGGGVRRPEVCGSRRCAVAGGDKC